MTSANVFTNNGGNVQIQDQNSYVEVKEITSGPNLRGKLGLVQANSNNKITFDQTISTTGIYYMGGVFYAYETTFQSVIFCIQTTIQGNGTAWSPYFCPVITVDATSTKISLYLVNSTYQEKFETTLPITCRGWQYFGVSLENIYDATSYVNTASVKMYDATGNLNTIALPFTTTNTGYLINESTIGSASSTTLTFIFNGLVRYFDICDDTTSCVFPSSFRSIFAMNKNKFYEHYWDLKTGTTYDGFKSVNPCLRNQEIGLTSNYFSFDKNAYPIYPTEKGWFTFNSSTQLSTNNLDFKDSHQFTLEFEVFPIDSSFQVSVAFESLTNSQKFSIYFQNTYTSSVNPYSFTSSVLLKSQKWNKVYITYARIGTSVRFLVHQLVLQAYGSTTQSVSSYSFDYPYSTYGFTGASIKPVFSGSRMIIKQIKTYLWALESVTVGKDFGIYSYSGDQDLTFSNQINPNYLDHFRYNTLAIDFASNACMSYVPSNTNICADLSQKVDETCAAQFELNTYFCIDKCGDGSVTTTPQTIQCDDGNNVSGDGCSKDCFIESGYECEIMPNLGNKSYCHPLCGNSRIDSGEECDDANYTNGDGCTASCKIEFGFKCTNYATKASTCFPNCGDMIRDTIPYVEECDDGNNIDFDGCSKTCKVEFNYQCNNNTGVDICITIYSHLTFNYEKIITFYLSLIKIYTLT